MNKALPVKDAADVVIVRLDAEDEDVPALAATLSTDEHARAATFAFERDRRRFVIARAKLRRLIALRLGVCAESLTFAYGINGKPALAPEGVRPDLRFNVSHSGDIAAYAFAYGRDVGIDIEAIRPMQGLNDLVTRHFSRQEQKEYFALDPTQRRAGFFNGWTRKEAFIKALGSGLAYPLSSFDVSLTPGEPARILRMADTIGKDCGWTLRAFCPARGTVGAVVVQQRPGGKTC